MQLTDHGAALFNPFPYAWEGKRGRAPDDVEFIEAFEAGAAEIRAALPGAAVVAYGLAEYRAVQEIRAFFEINARSEATFLRSVCPLILDRIRPCKEEQIETKIFEHCAKHGVARKSFACITALSCLYEDPHGDAYPIGREVLKPSRDYSAKAAYNAVCDLRHMTLAIISGALHGNQGFALATSDVGLASLSCALRPVGQLDKLGDIDVESELAPELFPRLSSAGLKRLEQLLRE